MIIILHFNHRRLGWSRVSAARQEADRLEIFPGIFEGIPGQAYHFARLERGCRLLCLLSSVRQASTEGKLTIPIR